MIPILRASDAGELKRRVMNRSQLQNEEVSRIVKEIVARVRQEGDAALFDYTAKFDHVTMTAETVLVTKDGGAAGGAAAKFAAARSMGVEVVLVSRPLDSGCSVDEGVLWARRQLGLGWIGGGRHGGRRTRRSVILRTVCRPPRIFGCAIAIDRPRGPATIAAPQQPQPRSRHG